MNRFILLLLLFCSFQTISFAELKIKPKKEKHLIIGPEIPVVTGGAQFMRCEKRVVYFPSTMYKRGMLEKIEFAFKKYSSAKGDTIGYKMPVMLKIYARDTVKNIPGEELLQNII